MKIGYIRGSTADQNPERQRTELEAADVEEIYEDRVSGKNLDRPQLQEMLAFIRKGDTIIVHSLDRLARNLSDLLKTVEALTQKGVSIHFLKEKLEFDAGKDASPTAKLMLQLVGAFAEFERSMIKARQREGIELAKARGAYLGRKRTVTPEQIEAVEKKMSLGMPLSVAAKKVGLSRSTVYRYLNPKDIKNSKSLD